MQNVTLYYKEGGSDKVYQASIEPKEGLFVVNFAFGRRGATLATGTKTAKPVDQATAVKIFEKIVAEKKAKGYSEGPEGTPYQFTDKEARVSGHLPQLLNPIDERELDKHIADPNWCMQEKFDGKRMMLMIQGEAISGINRKGLLAGLPSPIVEHAKKLGRDALVDGECIGEIFHAFDLLSLNGNDLRPLKYQERLNKLAQLLEGSSGDKIRPVVTAFSEKEKRQLRDRLKKSQGEGVVFKRLDAPYKVGRPASDGSQIKCKFYATASFIVGETNKSKRSVGLRLRETGRDIEAGNVTIPPNQAIPKVGQVVEVRYLYAFKESGSVYQPTFLGVREDIDPDDCKLAQLKYRASGEPDEQAEQ